MRNPVNLPNTLEGTFSVEEWLRREQCYEDSLSAEERREMQRQHIKKQKERAVHDEENRRERINRKHDPFVPF